MSAQPPLPPPPPLEPDWPPPTDPDATDAGGGGGRQKWWTGGRVVAAIVIVLVLMAAAGFTGFLAGAAWSGSESIAEKIAEGIVLEDFSGGFTDDFTDDFADDFSHGTDAPAVGGETLRVGSTVTGTLSDSAVEHPLVVETAGEVTIELRSQDFDTTLTLLDDDGEELAYNDDIEFGEDRNSRVEVSLPVGTYTVVVDTFGFGEGDYELLATS